MVIYNQSVQRTFLILEALSQYPSGLFFKELEEETDLNKSTLHRFLNDLMHLGYISQDENKKYILSFKLFELGNSKIKNLNIQELARPHLIECSKKANEIVHLVVPDDTDIVYIDKVEMSHNSITMGSHVGKRLPMVYTASGKALLSMLSNEDIRVIWEHREDKPVSGKGVDNIEDFIQEIEEVRKTGIAIDDEEYEAGIQCVGTMIFDYTASAVAGISISGPSFRMKDKMNESLFKLLKDTAQQISHKLGFYPQG